MQINTHISRLFNSCVDACWIAGCVEEESFDDIYEQNVDFKLAVWHIHQMEQLPCCETAERRLFAGARGKYIAYPGK